jgi:hypothetical protein
VRVWVAIWTGSSRISRGIAAWIAAGPLLRLALVVLAGGFLRGWPGWDVAVPILAAGWLVTAVVLGLRLPNPLEPGTAPGPSPAEQPLEAAPEPAGITREQLVRALHEVGSPHAHTAALAEHLGAPAQAVKTALAEAGIPTRGGVRMKGRRSGVSPGVHRDDFPPLPSPVVEAAPEGPLTSNNNDNNNSSSAAFTTVPDASNPARTLVRWLRR